MKRQVVPKNWPISRKGTKYVISKNSKGVPILILLRDLLDIAQNRKEVKQAIHKKDILSCGKPVQDDKKSLELFDVLTLVPGKKNYRVVLTNNGKYDLKEIEEKDAKTKVAKIINKKIIKDKKVQLNLSDGRNYISDVACSVHDSVIINFEKNKIEKVLPLKEKSMMLVIGGKHSGIAGKIEKIIPELKMVEISTGETKFRVLIKQLMITE